MAGARRDGRGGDYGTAKRNEGRDRAGTDRRHHAAGDRSRHRRGTERQHHRRDPGDGRESRHRHSPSGRPLGGRRLRRGEGHGHERSVVHDRRASGREGPGRDPPHQRGRDASGNGNPLALGRETDSAGTAQSVGSDAGPGPHLHAAADVHAAAHLHPTADVHPRADAAAHAHGDAGDADGQCRRPGRGVRQPAQGGAEASGRRGRCRRGRADRSSPWPTRAATA